MNFTIPTSQKYFRTIAIVGIVLAFLLSSSPAYAVEVVQSPQASTDDCYENDANAGLNCTGPNWVESGGTAAGRRNSAVRFPSINVPQGTTIDSAVLSMKTDATGAQKIWGQIFGNDVDNAGPLGDVTGLARTTANTFWQTGNLSSNTRYTHTVTTQVQEIINREGWVSGNAIAIILKGDSGSNYNAFMYSWDTSSTSADDPILTINFTVAPPTTTTQAVTNIEPTTSTGNGTTTSLEGVDGTSRGFVWGTTSLGDPGNVAPGATSYDDFISESGTFTEEAFTGDITSLAETTIFYIRAFTGTSEGGYGYGSEVSFTSGTTPSGLSVVMPQFIIFGVITWVILLLILQVRWGIMNNPAGVLITGTLGVIVVAILIAIAG